MKTPKTYKVPADIKMTSEHIKRLDDPNFERVIKFMLALNPLTMINLTATAVITAAIFMVTPEGMYVDWDEKGVRKFIDENEDILVPLVESKLKRILHAAT